MGAKLDAIIKEVNKKAKEEIITKGLSDYNYRRIPFTSPRMNYCTFGGIPVGKITEFYGEEHGGKTTTALDIISNYQSMENAREVLYVDAENTLDAKWAAKLGVDVENIYLYQPKSQSAEEIFDFICDSVESGEVGLWVLDSIGSLMSSQEWEKEMDESVVAGIAKPLTRFGKKVEMLMARTNCTGIGINQQRDLINARFPRKITPGGNAWRHFCSVRMEFSRGAFIDEKGNELTRSADAPVGNVVMMSMTKNKTCPPTRRVGQYTINYEYGIDYLRDLIEVAIRYDIVRKSGAWFDIVDPETGSVLNEDKIQGQANLYTYLDENENILSEVEQRVNKAMGILA